MGNKAKVAGSIGIFVVMVGSLVSYDAFFKDQINTEDVLVVKQGVSVTENQVLDGSNIEVVKRPKTQLPDKVLTASDAEKVTGKRAGVSISGNTVLTENHVDFLDLVPDADKGESIRPITQDMIFAVPNTLRRGDSVDIYALTENEWGDLTHSENEEIVKGDRNAVSKNDPVLEDIKVAYVRDSSNAEVQNAYGSTDEDTTTGEEAPKEDTGRLYGTSTVTSLEVILDEDDFQTLMSQVTGNGKKLYVVYN